MHPCALVFVLLIACSAAQTCSVSQNFANTIIPTLDVYNAACGDPARPYCTGVGLCSECSPTKNADECDCPANFRCVGHQYNVVRGAAFCAPLPVELYGRACATDNDCGVQLTNQNSGALENAYYGTCVSGLCKYCNPPAEQARICKQGEVQSGDPGLYGSKSEGRGCYAESQVWNSIVWPLATPLPTDVFAYERAEYTVATTDAPANGTHAQSGAWAPRVAMAMVIAAAALCA